MTQRKFLILFLFLLGYLIFYPYAGDSGYRFWAFRALTALVTLFSIYAVSYRRTIVIVIVLLAIPALLQHSRIKVMHAGTLLIVNAVLTMAFDAFVIAIIFRRVFRKDKATSETILGALCVYLLIGFSFTNVYMLEAALQPHAFYLDPLSNLHSIPDRIDLLYYSFATMTSVGAVGITPASAQARSLTAIEAVIGVLYLAVLVARLIGAYGARARAEAPSE
ncbi:MAG: ion channel [Acidobacteriaceae bacterium]